jgi:hypothetical protein
MSMLRNIPKPRPARHLLARPTSHNETEVLRRKTGDDEDERRKR